MDYFDYLTKIDEFHNRRIKFLEEKKEWDEKCKSHADSVSGTDLFAGCGCFIVVIAVILKILWIYFDLMGWFSWWYIVIPSLFVVAALAAVKKKDVKISEFKASSPEPVFNEEEPIFNEIKMVGDENIYYAQFLDLRGKVQFKDVQWQYRNINLLCQINRLKLQTEEAKTILSLRMKKVELAYNYFIQSFKDKMDEAPNNTTKDDELELYRRTFGINGQITRRELNQKYRDLMKKYHPDKVQHLSDEFKDMAAQKMTEINKAYEYYMSKFKD